MCPLPEKKETVRKVSDLKNFSEKDCQAVDKKAYQQSL
jgi:hypothetical protein